MTMHPLDIIKRDMAVAETLTDRPRRPMPEPEKQTSSLFGRLFCRPRRDEQIRHTMPWLVASGAITPAIYGRRK